MLDSANISQSASKLGVGLSSTVEMMWYLQVGMWWSGRRREDCTGTLEGSVQLVSKQPKRLYLAIERDTWTGFQFRRPTILTCQYASAGLRQRKKQMLFQFSANCKPWTLKIQLGSSPCGDRLQFSSLKRSQPRSCKWRALQAAVLLVLSEQLKTLRCHFCQADPIASSRVNWWSTTLFVVCELWLILLDILFFNLISATFIWAIENRSDRTGNLCRQPCENRGNASTIRLPPNYSIRHCLFWWWYPWCVEVYCCPISKLL